MPTMRNWVTVIGCTTLMLGTSAQSQAALFIDATFVGGDAPTNTTGGGSLGAIFEAAASLWEAAFPDPNGDGSEFRLAIDYSWAPRDGSTLATHNLLSEGGTPHRELSARIRFDNDGSSEWFLDATPYDSSEYLYELESSQDLGGGAINTQRQRIGAIGAANGQTDLLSVAIHEIGHALGLSSANNAFVAENADGEINVTTGPWDGGFAGTALATRDGAHLSLGTTVMYPSISRNIRKFATAADILANAQISRFHNPNLNPQFATIPEPVSAGWLLMIGWSIGQLTRRRRQVDR